MADLIPSVYAAAGTIISLTAWSVSILLCLLIGTISYRLLLHPLAGVPGPRLAAVSNIWLAYQVRNGKSVLVGKKLHQRYGPVVRVGPNEVWFNSKESFKAIYSELDVHIL
jgi:hypothetical protein